MRPLKILASLLSLLLAAAPGALAAPDQVRAYDTLRETGKEARKHAEHPAGTKSDVLEKAFAAHPYEGAAPGLVREPKTLYFHSRTPASIVDEIDEFTGGEQGPYMDPVPPADALPKVGTTTAFANEDFRKNFIVAYWAGKVNGILSGSADTDPTVTFWARSSVGTSFEVSIFGDGGAAPGSPLARKRVDVASPDTTRFDVGFPGLSATIAEEIVVQIAARDRSNQRVDAEVLFDSVLFPSAFSFHLAAIPPFPLLDDPIGIAFRGGDLIAANAGTGDVVKIVDGQPDAATLLSGEVQGGFTRGVTGLAVDAGGNVYVAVAETGEVRFVRPSGATGVYARGLGAPVGIAFDAAGNLYVADSAGHRLLSVDPTTRAVSEVVSGFARAPYGVAIAPSGAIAVTTQRDAKVHIVGGGTRTELADLGSSTHSAEGLAYAASGNLYVGDGAAGRVVRVTPAGAVTTAAAELGGPLNLAFAPGTQNLVAATHGEGRREGDAILTIATAESGLPPAAPSLDPTPLPDIPRAWVHRAGGLAVDPASYPGPLPQAAYRPVGRDAAEPTIGVQRDGDVYYVAGTFDAARGLLARSEIYRSVDDGLSWREVTPKAPVTSDETPPFSLDPYLWVDPATDRVFTIDLYVGCSWIHWSDDDGATWTSNPLACGVPVNDHQTIAGGPPRMFPTAGYPNVLYYCSNQLVETPCGRSLDGGLTWMPAGLAYPGVPQGGCGGGITGHLTTDPEGRVFLPTGSCGAPFVSVSEDDGLTWRNYRVSTLNSATHEAIVAADEAGNLYYAWVADSNRLPYMAVSTDHGRTWSEPVMVAPPGVTEANLPSIAAGAPGRVAILYMGTTADYGYGDRQYAKVSWNGYMTVSTNALSPNPMFASTVVNPLTDPLFRGACGPGRCGNVFDFLDVVVAPDGRAWGTFVDACTGPCVLYRSASPTDGEGVAAPLVAGPNLRQS